MIARWFTSGDPSGLIRYVVHDAGTPADPHPSTSDRVRWCWSINSGAGGHAAALKEIEDLIADAEALKAAAGISGRGRKSKKTMGHLILSWERGAEISEEHALETGLKAVHALGLLRHHAVLAFHDDRAHPHLHIAICRIDPETGRTMNKKNPAQTLSSYARAYEKVHGIVVPRREEIAQARERALAAEAGSAEQREAQQLEERLRRGRQLHRGPGRPRRPRWERREWAAGRRAGSADAVTKAKIEDEKVDRQSRLRDALDQRAIERSIARRCPTLRAGELELAAQDLAGGNDEQDVVARVGAAACSRLARRRPPIGGNVGTLPPRLLNAVRRAVEDALRGRGYAVTALTAPAAPAAKPLRKPPKPERGGLSR